MCTNQNAVKIVIPERTPELEARSILFAHRAVCDECSKTIEKLEDATAVLFFGVGVWKLLHRDGCAISAMLFLPASGSPYGISPRSYRRRFP
jgi:hypothetical protein